MSKSSYWENNRKCELGSITMEGLEERGKLCWGSRRNHWEKALEFKDEQQEQDNSSEASMKWKFEESSYLPFDR